MSSRFETEIQKLMAPLYRYAMALTGSDADAQDLVQETLLKTVKHREKFERMENRQSWLFTVMSNAFRDSIRRKRRRPQSGPLMLDPRCNSNYQEQKDKTQEHLAKAMGCFRLLPSRQRQVLYLRCVEEYSIKQIAQTLQTTENGVKANLSVARKKIRQLMAKDKQVLE